MKKNVKNYLFITKLFLLFGFFVPAVSLAEFETIALDSVTIGTGCSCTTNTNSHTTTGTNRILFVDVLGNTIANGDNVTGATYDGVAMTLLDKSNATTDRWQYRFYLVNPHLGTHDYVVTSNDSPDDILTPVAISYTGVEQSAPEVTDKYTGSETGGKTQAITTLTDGAWVVANMHVNAVSSVVAGTTVREAGFTYDKNGATNPAGSASVGLTWSGEKSYAYIISSLAPAEVVEEEVESGTDMTSVCVDDLVDTVTCSYSFPTIVFLAEIAVLIALFFTSFFLSIRIIKYFI